MNVLERCRVSWIRAKLIVKHISARPGYFRYRGVHVFHTGILLDQPRAASAIESAINATKSQGVSPISAMESLGRCIVRFVRADSLPNGVLVQAEWRGGFWDVGLIKIAPHAEWADHLNKAVIQMILSEQHDDGKGELRAVA